MALRDLVQTKWGRWVTVLSGAFLAVVGVHYVRRRDDRKLPDGKFTPERYVPGSPRQVELFERAADVAGVPRDWASDPSLAALIEAESDGWVGIPNYTYGPRKKDRSRWPEVWAELQRGEITTNSSATGIGQLKLSNADTYYPDKRAGIGDAFNEAVGMLRYIEDRYGHPSHAWRCHNRLCDDIPGKRPKTFKEGY